jgi:hypothetical protein
MGFDGRMTQRKARMLSTREAIALYGDGWECSETGAQIRQRLKLGLDARELESLLPSETAALNRAVRLLRRDRLTAQVFVEQLEAQARSIASIPFSRLIAGKKGKDVRSQIDAEKARIAALPTQPSVQRLDLDAPTDLPSDAKKVGTSIWFLDRVTMTLCSREIRAAVLEQLDGRPTLVYQTEGTTPAGTPVRRSCAHTAAGVKTLNSAETAFLDPIAARDHLATLRPTEAAPPLPPVAVAPPMPKAAATAAPPASPKDPLIDHGMDESLALQPFDESMLRGSDN